MASIFFDLSLNKLLSKQSGCRSLERPLRSGDVTLMIYLGITIDIAINT